MMAISGNLCYHSQGCSRPLGIMALIGILLLSLPRVKGGEPNHQSAERVDQKVEDEVRVFLDRFTEAKV